MSWRCWSFKFFFKLIKTPPTWFLPAAAASLVSSNRRAFVWFLMNFPTTYLKLILFILKNGLLVNNVATAAAAAVAAAAAASVIIFKICKRKCFWPSRVHDASRTSSCCHRVVNARTLVSLSLPLSFSLSLSISFSLSHYLSLYIYGQFFCDGHYKW